MVPARQATAVLRIRIRDPVPFWPLDPGSAIGFFWIPDLGSRIPNPYVWELSDNFLGKKLYEIRDPGSGMGKNQDPPHSYIGCWIDSLDSIPVLLKSLNLRALVCIYQCCRSVTFWYGSGSTDPDPRIRIRGSVPLTNESGSDSWSCSGSYFFRQWLQDGN